MQTVPIYKRLTRKYRDGWRHLDKEEFLCRIRLTESKTVEKPCSFDDGGKYVQYTRAPAGTNLDELARAIISTMGGSNCQHEHDCCGCASFHVQVHHMGSRRLKVTTSVSYNY